MKIFCGHKCVQTDVLLSEISVATFPDFGEKLSVAPHCPKSHSARERESQISSALSSHHLLPFLLSFRKHPFWESVMF